MVKDYVIGIDIGGTNFRIGLVSAEGELEHFQKKSSSILSEGNAAENLLAQIYEYIDECGVCGRIKAVTVGIPSIVSKDKKTVYSTPNLDGFDNIDLATPLQTALNIPVFIDRDVNYLLLNDIKQCSLDVNSTILGFYIGTGFGNAVYIDGKFHTGKNGVAGELGHIPLHGIAERCTCGNIGCAEVICSGKHLEELAKNCFPGTEIANIFAEHADDKRIREFVEDLAIPIATEVNILDPDTIIVAGGVVIMKGFPKELLVNAIRERARKPYPSQNLEILFTEHTQYSGVLGGARFAYQVLKAV